MADIRHIQNDDWPDVWQIIEPVFRAGETYPYPIDIAEPEARHAWLDAPEATFIAVDESAGVLGTYYIKPNQPGLGSHVCNCGYVVAAEARGRGVASLMCVHSQQQAVVMGFRAMQYNLVVSTNEQAVRLWKRYGFDVVGRLPGAFDHARFGFVDALVMYKQLGP